MKLFGRQVISSRPEGPPRRAEDLALYCFPSCPYCVRVSRALKRLNLDIEQRNIHKVPAHRQALLEGGGRTMVPCLRIEHETGVEWMYESLDIVRYLERRFAEEKV